MDLFSTVFKREKQQQASLEKIQQACAKAGSKKTKTTANFIPKTMKSKIDYAKEVSQKVFGKKIEDLELMTSESRIKEYFKKVFENGIVAIDTETNGLDRVDGIIAGVCLYTPGETGCYIPVNHISYMTKKPKGNANIELVGELIRKVANDGVKTIFHNAKFDMHFLYWWFDALIVPYWCTHIASCCLDENEPHGLKALWSKYCGEKDSEETVKFNKLFKGVDFREIPPEVAYMYAGFDPKMTYELYEFQEQYLNPDNPLCYENGLEEVAVLFREVEMPMLSVAFTMEREGVPIDTELAKKLNETYSAYRQEAYDLFISECEKIQGKIDKLSTTKPVLYKKLDKPISITSATQLAILLYDIMKFVSPDDKKPRGTGDDIIAHFDHPIVDAVRQYRKFEKAIGTYIEAIPNAISKRTGKLHANFNTRGAKTGRLSSDQPNLQNIPSRDIKLKDGTKIQAGKDIRQLFVAGEGKVFIGGDFSQQEPRTLAYLANETTMLQAYKDGLDLYSLMASDLYGFPYEECKEFRPDGTVNKEGKDRRSSVKSVLLGILYGRGSGSIAEQMGMTKKEAEKFIINFFSTYPKIAEFIEDTQENAREYGFVRMAWGGKRRLPDMQLNEIELVPLVTDRAETFDALDFGDSNDEVDDYVPDEVWYKYARLMRKCWSRSKKEEIKERALEEGYKLIDNGGKIADAERQCVNSVIQGSSAIMSKKAMIKISNHPRLLELGVYPTLPIHDEVICTCPAEHAVEIAEILEDIMVNIVYDEWGMKMKTDIECSYRWYGESFEPEEIEKRAKNNIYE